MFRKLNVKQLSRLSEFLANLGLVFFAGLVLPSFAGVDKVDPFNVRLGLTLTLICVSISLLLLRK